MAKTHRVFGDFYIPRGIVMVSLLNEFWSVTCHSWCRKLKRYMAKIAMPWCPRFTCMVNTTIFWLEQCCIISRILIQHHMIFQHCIGFGLRLPHIQTVLSTLWMRIVINKPTAWFWTLQRCQHRHSWQNKFLSLFTYITVAGISISYGIRCRWGIL